MSSKSVKLKKRKNGSVYSYKRPIMPKNCKEYVVTLRDSNGNEIDYSILDSSRHIHYDNRRKAILDACGRISSKYEGLNKAVQTRFGNVAVDLNHATGPQPKVNNGNMWTLSKISPAMDQKFLLSDIINKRVELKRGKVRKSGIVVNVIERAWGGETTEGPKPKPPTPPTQANNSIKQVNYLTFHDRK